MREDHSSTGEPVELTDQLPEDPANVNLDKPFKPGCIDLTPALPTNIGYVGGVRVIMTKG
jgi:hypothetical protein